LVRRPTKLGGSTCVLCRPSIYFHIPRHESSPSRVSWTGLPAGRCRPAAQEPARRSKRVVGRHDCAAHTAPPVTGWGFVRLDMTFLFRWSLRWHVAWIAPSETESAIMRCENGGLVLIRSKAKAGAYTPTAGWSLPLSLLAASATDEDARNRGGYPCPIHGKRGGITLVVVVRREI
jgi:hypothetical protein